MNCRTCGADLKPDEQSQCDVCYTLGLRNELDETKRMLELLWMHCRIVCYSNTVFVPTVESSTIPIGTSEKRTIQNYPIEHSLAAGKNMRKEIEQVLMNLPIIR